MYWLRLIRWNNLIIILLTQLVAWLCVIVPLKGPLLLSPFHFSLLCISTILIAAAGYVINDYFDIRIDAINKPEKVILEKIIPRRRAIIVHSVMNAVALVMALYVALKGHHPEWILLQISCTVLLWRYSTTFKRQFMIGNIVVALMTALTIGALMLYEPSLYHENTDAGKPYPVWVLTFFAFFAFALTWMREVVKDMEDFKGDEAEGCVTMPIQLGLQKSILFVRALGILVLLVLATLSVFLFQESGWMMLCYLIAVLLLPITFWLVFVGKAFTQKHFHTASRYLKVIMVLGIGSLLLYRFNYG